MKSVSYTLIWYIYFIILLKVLFKNSKFNCLNNLQKQEISLTQFLLLSVFNYLLFILLIKKVNPKSKYIKKSSKKKLI